MNTSITPFQFDTHTVRTIIDETGEPWFVGKDICEALGYKDATTAIRSHCKGVQKLHPLQTPGGTQEVRVLAESDVLRLIVNSTLPAAEKFERWVFEEVLPTLRKTGTYTMPGAVPPAAPPTAIPAAKEFRALFGAARLVGLDKNAAAISANQATARITGTNLLSLMGLTHLTAPDQSSLYHTPTELGAEVGMNARQFNLLLAAAGLQVRIGDHWEPTPAADGLCRVLDTGKRHGDGTMVQQVKWASAVLKRVPLPRKDEAV